MISALFIMALAPESASTCTLTAADKVANAKLSFDDFDQKGTTPATARQLAEAGCWIQAAEATQHYLVFGPLGTEAEQRVLRFHLAQQLANTGRQQEAAAAVAGARNRTEDLTDPNMLRWNAFVRGHWAFFVKDRVTLRAAIAEANAGQGFGNKLNVSLLEGLERCFDRSYGDAVKAPCRVIPEMPK